MTAPPILTAEHLGRLRLEAIEIFREERMQEPLEDYLDAFDEYLGVTEELLEASVDLRQLEEHALGILTNENLLEAFRYLAAPPISEADLKTVADVSSLAAGRLSNDPDAVREIVRTVLIGIDRKRFPWVQENRDPQENERYAAALATAALLATQRVGTNRRTTSKSDQEDRVQAALIGGGFTQVNTRPVSTLADAPQPGEFCRESMLGTRKADFVIGLHDRRILALECKVSNSELNSIKRLNNDAAVKAGVWLDEFGARNVVPGAMLSGVYKLRHLEQAQQRGLTLFWAHRLDELVGWIASTRPVEAPPPSCRRSATPVIMPRRRTKAEQAKDWDRAKRQAWDEFHPRLASLTSMDDAYRLVADAPIPDSPGRSYFSNLAFFLGDFTPPGGAGVSELALYAAFIERLDAAGALKAGAAAQVKSNLQRAIDSASGW